jgi:TfoX/Sxy family transcriptional regulator of competence genes
MAYDEALAARIREAVAKLPHFTEMKMFGGIAFMHQGNMVLGVVKEDLMARVGAEAHQEALKQPGARPMDFAGRPMVGMVFVGPAGTKKESDLHAWIERAMRYARTMEPKKPKTKRPRRATKRPVE